MFDEADHERVQESALRWPDDHRRTFRPVVRQQFSLSLSGVTRQTENYHVALHGLTDLELHNVPDYHTGRVPISAAA